MAANVSEEGEMSDMFGPNTAQVEAFLRVVRGLSGEQVETARAAWVADRDAAVDAARDAAVDAARVAAWDAARGAAWYAVWVTAWDAARGPAWGAVLALVVRDLISPEHFDVLTAPMRAAGVNFDAL